MSKDAVIILVGLIVVAGVGGAVWYFTKGKGSGGNTTINQAQKDPLAQQIDAASRAIGEAGRAFQALTQQKSTQGKRTARSDSQRRGDDAYAAA